MVATFTFHRLSILFLFLLYDCNMYVFSVEEEQTGRARLVSLQIWAGFAVQESFCLLSVLHPAPLLPNMTTKSKTVINISKH